MCKMKIELFPKTLIFFKKFLFFVYFENKMR